MKRLLSVLVPVLLALPVLPTIAQAKAPGPNVTMTIAATSLTGGEKVVVRGKVQTQAKVRRTVELQAKIKGLKGWAAIASRKTNARGAVTFRFAAPNPEGRGVVRLRLKALPVKSAKLPAALRKAGTSAATRVTFANNPAIAQPVYTLPLPAACVTESAGVQAKTAACVAAMEVQHMERMWLDAGRLTKLEKDPTLTLELGFRIDENPSTDAETYAQTVLLSPYYFEVVPMAALTAVGADLDEYYEAMSFAPLVVSMMVTGLFPEARAGQPWRAAWTDRLLLTDLSQVVIDGDKATMPTREFKDGDATVTVGGVYTYAEGVWVPDLTNS